MLHKCPSFLFGCIFLEPRVSCRNIWILCHRQVRNHKGGNTTKLLSFRLLLANLGKIETSFIMEPLILKPFGSCHFSTCNKAGCSSLEFWACSWFYLLDHSHSRCSYSAYPIGSRESFGKTIESSKLRKGTRASFWEKGLVHKPIEWII